MIGSVFKPTRIFGLYIKGKHLLTSAANWFFFFFFSKQFVALTSSNLTIPQDGLNLSKSIRQQYQARGLPPQCLTALSRWS